MSQVSPPKHAPVTWSELDLFERDRDAWYRRYIIGEIDTPTRAMKRGTDIHSFLLLGDTTIRDRYTPDENRIHDRIKAAFDRLTSSINGDIEPETRLAADWCDATVSGTIDAFFPCDNRLFELKTGSALWTPERMLEHGQLYLYAALAGLNGRRIDRITLMTASTQTGKSSVYVIEDRARIEYNIELIGLRLSALVDHCKSSGLFELRYNPRYETNS